jgi:WD40 repeat protein
MQVCNLVWSKNVNELVSTHGYSQNQIIVWRYPTMSKVAWKNILKFMYTWIFFNDIQLYSVAAGNSDGAYIQSFVLGHLSRWTGLMFRPSWHWNMNVLFSLFIFFALYWSHFHVLFQTIVTGAGDETLRFWNVFPCPKSQVCNWHACYNLGVNFVCLTKYNDYLMWKNVIVLTNRQLTT